VSNLDECPICKGPADNGHDRELPPNPYLCTKCENNPLVGRVMELEYKNQMLMEILERAADGYRLAMDIVNGRCG
jgi:hypothetical protein